jgi:hypothetical protein
VMDALGNEDERSKRDSRWDGYTEGHPYDWRKGGFSEAGLLPRNSSW